MSLRVPLPRLVRIALVTTAAAGGVCGCSDGPGEGPTVPLQDASAEEASGPQDAGAEAEAGVSGDAAASDGEAGADAGIDAPDAAADAAAMSHRIASLNLHCLKTDGTGYATNQQRFEAIAQTIAGEGIAAVAVQEACVAGSTDALELLRAAIETATGESWSKRWMEAHVGWQGTPDEATEGVGILARGPLTNVTEVVFRQQSSLRRVMIGATLPAPLGGLRLWSLHLEFNDPDVKLQQAREAAAVAIAEADPSWDVVVAGDFNAVGGSPAASAFESMGFVELTASLGASKIDHIFAHRGAAISLQKASVLFDGTAQPKVSDHPGVMVELTPAAAPPVIRTRLVAHTTTGQEIWLALRGGTAPLDWSWGWPAWRRADGSWLAVFSELPSGAPIEYKWLTGDAGWQTGANAVCAAGTDCELTPSF